MRTQASCVREELIDGRPTGTSTRIHAEVADSPQAPPTGIPGASYRDSGGSTVRSAGEDGLLGMRWVPCIAFDGVW